MFMIRGKYCFVSRKNSLREVEIETVVSWLDFLCRSWACFVRILRILPVYFDIKMISE